mgnify:CR=1 FL=1
MLGLIKEDPLILEKLVFLDETKIGIHDTTATGFT